MNEVAAVIPVYKEYQYLHKAITSVCHQTFTVSEICIVDDGSHDPEISRIVESFQDPRIRLVCLPENRGISVARNVGVSVTKSPFVAFLDADDYWAADKIENQIEFYHAKKASIVGSSLVFHQALKSPEFFTVTIPEQPLKTLFSHLFVLSPSSLFLSRKTFFEIGGFDETVRFGEDWDFLVRAALKNQKFGTVQSLTHMQVHPKSFSYSHYPKNDIRKFRQKYLRLSKQDPRLTPHMVAQSLSAMARWMQGKHHLWFEFYLLTLAWLTSPRIIVCHQFRGNVVHSLLNRKKIHET